MRTRRMQFARWLYPLPIEEREVRARARFSTNTQSALQGMTLRAALFLNQQKFPISRIASAALTKTAVLVCAILIQVLLVSTANAETSPDGSHISRNLDFLDEPELESSAAVTRWIDQSLAEKLGLGGDNTLEVGREYQSVGGYTIISVQQHYQRIPVVGLESKLALDKQQRPLFSLGKHSNISQQSPTTAEVGLAKALQMAGHAKDSEFTHRMVYWSDDYSSLMFSYEFEGSFASLEGATLEYQRVYVDASSGKVLQRVPLTHSAMRRQVNDFGAACDAMKVRWPLNNLLTIPVEAMAASKFSRTESGRQSASADVNQAFALLGDAYDFLWQVLGMDSIDDNGKLLKMYINSRFHQSLPGIQCSGNAFNAVWMHLKQALYIPNQGLDLIEITMHELGHGIVSNGSNLEYAFESGALNESIADAVGVSFRIWLELGKGTSAIPPIPRQYWKLRAPDGDGVTRDLADPSSVDGRFPYPDHYSEVYRWGMDLDAGGVHFNSSIMNKAFYLLAEGGRHPRANANSTVDGIGVLKAVKIYGLAGAAVLQSRSNFEDARFAFARTAELLFGKHSREWRSVHQAMDAVGIPGSWDSSLTNDAEPEPEPVPKPQPEADAEPEEDATPAEQERVELPEEQPDSSDSSADSQDSNRPDSKFSASVLAAVMLLMAVVIAVWLLVKGRHRRRPSTLAEQPPRERGRVRDVEAEPGKKNKLQTCRIAGRLVSLDDQHALPLFENLLRSREGQVLGRAEEVVHVRLESKSISRRHLRLRRENDDLIIEDLNSSLGTEVEGERLRGFEPRKIVDGQEIKLAEYSYRVTLV